eukprot:392859-Pleurochrysis_carterae.AAC.4
MLHPHCMHARLLSGARRWPEPPSPSRSPFQLRSPSRSPSPPRAATGTALPAEALPPQLLEAPRLARKASLAARTRDGATASRGAGNRLRSSELA